LDGNAFYEAECAAQDVVERQMEVIR